MKKFLKYFGFGALLILIGGQFIRPERTNPVAADSLFFAQRLRASPEVVRIVESSCLDCHSFRTRWPWYASVAPVSWLVASDVNGGRKRLNFSIWGSYTAQRQLVALNDIVDMISEGEMPPEIYTSLHPEARLDSAARKMLVDWAEAAKDSIPG